MEKIICAFWAGEGESRADFGARLVSELPSALKAVGASGIRLNIRDAAVAAAGGLVQTWQHPQQDAVAQFWLPSANAILRGPVDTVLAAQGARHEMRLVAESTIIANREHAPARGERTWGWSQASFISFLPQNDWNDSVNHWHSHHTRVAIETQANFEYVQNIIVRPLTATAPDYDAFVEECFPASAMSDPRAFFDAVGDEARFEVNLREMNASCTAFIDFARIDIIPTSQYDFADI